MGGRVEETADPLSKAECSAQRIAVAHQLRAMPPVRRTLEDVQRGTYGKLLSLRARPKDDHRGGGEELIVHGFIGVGCKWLVAVDVASGPGRRRHHGCALCHPARADANEVGFFPLQHIAIVGIERLHLQTLSRRPQALGVGIGHRGDIDVFYGCADQVQTMSVISFAGGADNGGAVFFFHLNNLLSKKYFIDKIKET